VLNKSIYVNVGGRIRILPWPIVDCTWIAAYDD